MILLNCFNPLTLIFQTNLFHAKQAITHAKILDLQAMFISFYNINYSSTKYIFFSLLIHVNGY